MPELIEVETYRLLADGAVGREIAEVVAPDGWYLKGGLTAAGATEALAGRRIAGTRRRGKLLLLDTSDVGGACSGPTLGLRFGMTGRLLLDGLASIERLEYSSDRDDPAWDRFSLGFVDGGRLRMRDPRRLGGVELDPDEERLGPDAATIDREGLVEVLGPSGAPLKVRLMDQARLAGLGNLLTDEMLWRAGLDPARPAGELSEEEMDRLHGSLVGVLDELTRRGGSHTGDLQDERRPGGHCPADGAPLQRRRLGGRTTYSCPDHQQ